MKFSTELGNYSAAIDAINIPQEIKEAEDAKELVITNGNIELLNVLGQRLISLNKVQGFTDINLSNQNSGIYTVKVSSLNNMSTYKVIKN